MSKNDYHISEYLNLDTMNKDDYSVSESLESLSFDTMNKTRLTLYIKTSTALVNLLKS